MSDIWAGTSGPKDAAIAIVGESFGKEEAEVGRPFVGPAGGVLDGMLGEAGIDRKSCFVTNVVSARPTGNDMAEFFEPGDATLAGLRPGAVALAGLAALYAQLDTIKPKIVLAFGNYALWALTHHAGSAADGPRARVPNGILDWRGSQVYCVRDGLERSAVVGAGVDSDRPVLPLVHPAAILRDWTLRSVTVADLRRRVPLALGRRWAAADRQPVLDLQALTSFEQADAVLGALLFRADKAAAAGQLVELVCDIETARASLITCIGIAPSPDLAYSLPFVRLTGTKAMASFWTAAQEAWLLKQLGKLLSHAAVRWIGQNFLYDRAFLWEWFRIEPKVSWDTLSGQNLLLPGTPKDLGYLASLYCKHYRFWKRDSRDWTEDAAVGLETHLRYNAEDCARTFEVAVEQRKALAHLDAAEGGRLRLWPIEASKIELAWEMQKRGMRVDQARRTALATDLIDARGSLAGWLESVVPQALLDAEGVTPKSGTRWFASPRQTAVLLYEVLGLRLQRNRKTGSVSTDDEAVGALKGLYPRLAGLFAALLEYRSLGVLFGTFIEAKLEADGRFRAAFNPAGTATFRFSSSKNPFKRGGNFQNIPSGDEE